MGNPSAPVAALDALAMRLEALLAAVDRHASGDVTAPALVLEDRAFWDALAPEITRDVGVFVATTDASVEALAARLGAMIAIGSVRGRNASVGIVRIAEASFHGLKVAQRWDVLQLASRSLLNVVVDSITQRLDDDDNEDLLLVLMDMYEAILLGFQHSGELMPRAQTQVATLAPRIAALGRETLTRRFIVTAAALVHCHCAYEAECGAIRSSLADAFSPELVQRPIAECEAALRKAAWILSPTRLNQYLSTFEGKWMQDEFSSEQHASGASAPQNAGSISLKKVANVLAYDFHASIDDVRNKTQMQLDGALFRPVKKPSDADDRSSWHLEGHWCQVIEPAAPNSSLQIATPVILAEPWTCAVCTFKNEGSAAKCATCGAEAPKNTSSQMTQAGAKTTNPAPFQAIFDPDHTFMRVRWSRGEQSGVWLAKKEVQRVKFDLTGSLREASASAMADSSAVPIYAFSPRGEASRVMMLEKSYSLSTYGEMAMEVWIQIDGRSTNQPKQTVIASGEFELFVQQSSGALVWDIGSGMHVISTDRSLLDDEFHHVVLLFGKQNFQILVDGVVASEVHRKLSDHSGIPSQRPSWFTIGGSITHDLQHVGSCFYGAILDLRIWSDVTARTLFSPSESLGGAESGLIGYFPMVGNSHRILQDASKHGNHATVFGNGLIISSTLSVNNNTLLPPCSQIENIPVVNNFFSAVGDFEISGLAVQSDNHDDSTLRLEHPSAVWHNTPISIAEGFQSVVTLQSTKSSPSYARQLVFTVCDSSFWDAPSLIAEVSSLGLPYDPELMEHRFRGSALFVALERVAVDNGLSDVASVTVYVWKNRRPLQLCRMSGLPLISDAQTGLAVTYARSAHVMKIEVLGSQAAIEVGVDIEAALELQSPRVRAGIVVTSPLLQSVPGSPSPCSSELTKWTFEAIDRQSMGPSVVHQIYSRLKQGLDVNAASDRNGSSSQPMQTISCTRTSSDGSAIEQATYGCQTCGIIHGAGLCSVCATACHEGHELVYMGSMITACACAVRAGHCKCSSPVPVSDYPSVGQSLPRVAQWYCTRCTVVNSADVRECTVCANTAPDSSLLGRAPAVTTAPESTSRALVPVPAVETPPITIPSEWACPACTYLNTGDAPKCIICDSARPSSNPEGPRDGLMTLYNAAESQQHQTAPAVAAPPTTPWYCGACTMENKPADNVCFMCQTARAVPVADPVEMSDVTVGVPVSSSDVVSMATPVETGVNVNLASPAENCSSVENAVRLSNSQLAEAMKAVTAPEIDLLEALVGSVWDSSAGALTMKIGERPFVAHYVEGEYVEKDGYVRGLVHLSTETPTVWKLTGRFKKTSQSQENAVSLGWDRGVSRFDGKWFRGDGSGEWKCVAAPLANDFRGLALVDVSKSSSDQQPFYSGLINMKQNLTNVCYQNSFLQSLFITQAFRRLILSRKIEDCTNLSDNMESGSQGDVLKAVQDLFARLIASQRPELDSHILQRCLPATFQAGRQQDTSDFAHFLIDSLSQQLNQHQSTAHGIDDIFGGTQATILSCKTCGKRSINREYFWELLVNMIDLRYTPITGISAVSGVSKEISTPHGYERINNDLNKDRNGVPYVYLCVKRKPEVPSIGPHDPNFSMAEMPITDLAVKVVGFADPKPVLDGYERVELDLNVGGSTVVIGGKKQVYLFFRREPNGSPITDLHVVYGNEPVPDGFKQIRVDINQGEGSKVFLCYRCDMPITDMKIVNSGIPGYRMVDFVLNRTNEDAVKQYLAYKVGGSDPCITDLKLISAAEVAAHTEQGWETLGSPSSTVDGGATPELLVIRRGHGNPIFAVDVFRAPRQVPKYNDYEVIDLYGAGSPTGADTSVTAASLLKGDWLADEAVDRGRKSVRIHAVSDPIPDGLVIKGEFEDKGEISAIATASMTSWSTATLGDKAPAASDRVLRVTGYWKSSKTKQAQLFDVELRPEVADGSDSYSLGGTIGDGRGRPVAIKGTQTSRAVRVKWPISQLLVLRGDERVPEGVEVVRETCSGKTGNLLAQTQSPHTLYLAVKREENPSEGFIGDVCVIYGEIDAVPENYVSVQATPMGHSANLNDGTTGVPIFICYRRVSAPSDKCLMDLALMWTSGAQADTLPTGFTKIQHTPLGMDANLNQGTTGVSIHLCFAKCDPADVVRPIDDPVNGEYEIAVVPTLGSATAQPAPLIGKFIRLSVTENVGVVHTLEGKFGTVFHGYQPGMVRGTFYHSQQRKQRVVAGVWMSDEQNASSMIDFVPPSFPFEWSLNEANNELDGWWSTSDDSPPSATGSSSASNSSASAASTTLPWKLMKDAYVRVAYKKDYGTEWKHGKLISSERVWRHDVQSMLSRFVASRTLGGDNLLSCSKCERKTESRTNTVVVAPPAHLILTIKRMFYDWAQQKTRKSLHDVTFPAVLTLPGLTSDDEEAVYSDAADGALKAEHRHRQYGLYGVLVHSGLTANSGHYFSYCRESDDSSKQLHLEDSSLAPWIKFNDSRVEKSSWAEINAAVSSSVSDTVYLLLYKRLSYKVPHASSSASPIDGATAMDVEHTDDEDEAMLLAKAMALSMSAAQKKAQAESEIKEEDVKTGDDDPSGELSPTEAIRPFIDSAVVHQVEAANTQFLFDAMQTSTSSVHVQDLHAALALQLGIQVEPVTYSSG